MYILLVYDINEERVNYVLKTCRIYLHHVQNSVHEGPITHADFKELCEKLRGIINEDEDSIMIYVFRSRKLFKKKILGIEKNPADTIVS